jgi:hypothetical protein
MKTSPEASPPASPDSHRKRLELNRLAAFKSRQKKKIESEQLRLQLLQLSQTKEQLEQRLSEFMRVNQEQSHEASLLHIQLQALLRENMRLRQTHL